MFNTLKTWIQFTLSENELGHIDPGEGYTQDYIEKSPSLMHEKFRKSSVICSHQKFLYTPYHTCRLQMFHRMKTNSSQAVLAMLLFSSTQVTNQLHAQVACSAQVPTMSLQLYQLYMGKLICKNHNQPQLPKI